MPNDWTSFIHFEIEHRLFHVELENVKWKSFRRNKIKKSERAWFMAGGKEEENVLWVVQFWWISCDCQLTSDAKIAEFLFLIGEQLSDCVDW